MEKTIGIAKARDGLSDLINEVAYGSKRYVVERSGKPLVVLIGADEYRRLTELSAEQGVNDEVRGIAVRSRYDGEPYFVGDDRLDLYGAGATIQEAREDSTLAVDATYADLSANADRLAAPPPHVYRLWPDGCSSRARMSRTASEI